MLALQDLQDSTENGRGRHRPGVWLIQARRADVTGSSSSSFHVPGGLGGGFRTLRGGGVEQVQEAATRLPSCHGPRPLLSQH